MKVLFLDFDGVINSQQSFTFWHHKRDQQKWENELYQQWHGTLREYLANEFCPIATSNLEELMRQVPDLKIVVSSTWRMGETVESLKKILQPFTLVAEAIIDTTPIFRDGPRGNEIQHWLNNHPEVTNYLILDDSGDMLDSQKDHFVQTSWRHGLLYDDVKRGVKILTGVEGQ